MEKNYSLRHLRYFTVCPPLAESLLWVPVCIENRGPRGIEGSRGGSRDGGYILSGGKLCARKLSVRKISARRKCARNPRTFTLFTCCVQAAAAAVLWGGKGCKEEYIFREDMYNCSSSILFQSCLEKFWIKYIQCIQYLYKNRKKNSINIELLSGWFNV